MLEIFIAYNFYVYNITPLGCIAVHSDLQAFDESVLLKLVVAPLFRFRDDQAELRKEISKI